MDPITLALIVSAIAGLGGTALQYQANRDAQERQKRAIDAAQATQAELERQRNAQVVANAEQMTPQRTGEVLQQRVIAPAQSRLEGVAQQAARDSSAPAPVGASARYDTEAAKRSAAELERAIAEAGLMARANAGRGLMFEQGLEQAQGASNIDDIASQMAQAARRSNVAIQQAGQVNPGQMLAGGLLQASGPIIGAGVGGGSGTPAAASGSGLTASGGGATGLTSGTAGMGLRAPTRNPFGFDPRFALR